MGDDDGRFRILRLPGSHLTALLHGRLRFADGVLPEDAEVVGCFRDEYTNPPTLLLKVHSEGFGPVAPGGRIPEPVARYHTTGGENPILTVTWWGVSDHTDVVAVEQ